MACIEERHLSDNLSEKHLLQDYWSHFNDSASKTQQSTTTRSPSNYLTVSPYPSDEHLLDLRTLDQQTRLFAIALTTLTNITARYATAEYEQAFNWSAVMKKLKDLFVNEGLRWEAQTFDVIVFRSQVKANADIPLLSELDKHSHQEATASGGLLKYWWGVLDSERRNLATCLWRSKEDAVKGGQGPWHRQARMASRQMYDKISVEHLQLVIADDVSGWTFSQDA